MRAGFAPGPTCRLGSGKSRKGQGRCRRAPSSQARGKNSAFDPNATVDQSGLAPDALTTLAHFSVSDAMKALNSAGV
jgi:hypothetical protein